MSQTYTNLGPIYITQAKYDALVSAGTVELGREYVIVDSHSEVKDVKVNNTSVVTDGVANIPLANASNPGVIKTSPNEYFTDIDASGKLKGSGKTYQQYSTQGMGPSIICKETLENVLDNESVRFDKSTSLTDNQKTQARTNIGAGTLIQIEFLGENE